VHGLRDAAERQLRGKAVRVRRVFHFFRHHVALPARERPSIGASAEMHLVRTDADRRKIRVASRIERGRRIVVVPVAELAVAGDVVDHSVHVSFRRNDPLLGVDHVCVAGVTTIGLWMRGGRR